MASIKGIDISKWQGDITFSKVAKSTNFVIMKATEGVGYTDSKFSRNQQGLRNARVATGYYHFARPDLGNTAANEADWFIKTVGVLRKGELLALDYEVNYGNPVVWCKTFLDRVKTETGVKPLIYINLNTNNKYNWSTIVKGDYGLWLAYWDGNLTNKPKTDWPFIAIKQYGADTKVDGITGNVDGNVFFGDLTTLKKYGYQGNTTNPPVEPSPEPIEECAEQKAIIFSLEKAIETKNEKIEALETSLELCIEEKTAMKGELKASEDKYATLVIEKKTLANTNEDLVKELNELKSKSCVKQLIDKFFKWLHETIR
ncbi:TPA: hypothetical protein DEP90_02795 [Patescibacteria group bacterium]|nr:hypothetical protein [Patescibacteria group bacterium]